MLYPKYECSDYKQKIINNICLSFEEEKFSSEKELRNYVPDDISMTKPVTEDTFLDDIRNITKKYIAEGVTVEDLREILKIAFGLSGTYCYDALQLIQKETDLQYSEENP
jgi:hypothetical protein